MFSKGIRYRKNYGKLLGKPDIVLTKYKIALFCDGEFFHGKDWEVLKPRLQKSNNSEFWINKISKNRERDEDVNKKLLFVAWIGGQPTATSTQQNFWLVGLLRTLESEGIVERDVTTKKWRLK